MKYLATVDEHEYEIEILSDGLISIDGNTHEVDFQNLGEELVYSLLLDGRSFEALVSPIDDAWQVLLKGTQYTIYVEDERDRRLRAAAGSGVAEHREFHLKAPMPGLIVDIPVSDGQTIEKGEVLLILESMKMQNELRAPRAGVVSRIRDNIGDSVDQRDILLIVN